MRKKLKECCINFAITSEEDRGMNHHVNCPNYETEKFVYLFYCEDAINAWTPAPDEIAHIIDVDSQLHDGEEIEITFKRFDMTDQQFAAMPCD